MKNKLANEQTTQDAKSTDALPTPKFTQCMTLQLLINHVVKLNGANINKLHYLTNGMLQEVEFQGQTYEITVTVKK